MNFNTLSEYQNYQLAPRKYKAYTENPQKFVYKYKCEHTRFLKPEELTHIAAPIKINAPDHKEI